MYIVRHVPLETTMNVSEQCANATSNAVNLFVLLGECT